MVSAQGGVVTTEEGEVIGEGFNGPQGVLMGDDGAIWVIDSGLGGDDTMPFFSTQSMSEIEVGFGETSRIVRIDADGAQEEIATLPSLISGIEALGGSRLVMVGDIIYATVGQGAGSPEKDTLANFGGVVKIEDGEVTQIASTWDFERANNPDGTSLHDSHPYGLTVGPDGYLYVADAGANDILRVDPETGEIDLVAVLDPLPGVFPDETRDGEMLMDPVPTAIDFDAENMYVSYLAGVPFIPGTAGVKIIGPDGEVADFATGLTMLTDLRRGPDGYLYGVQYAIFTDSGPEPNSGSVVRIKGGQDFDVVVDGLPLPTALTFNDKGDLFVSINGLGAPGSGAVLAFSQIAPPPCGLLPDRAELTEALKTVVSAEDSGGFGSNVWGTLVNRDGEVCAVTFSGEDRGDQWPGGRVMSAQKAHTANAFSLPGLALSTGNLFTAVQPGNSLAGLENSNPVNTSIIYAGDAETFGQEGDPMVGNRIGGVSVFGGGLALYTPDGVLVGALGISGDTTCAGHIVAWKVRDALELDYVPAGVSETDDDNLVYDPTSSWAHPTCGLDEESITTSLPETHPIGIVE
jgi:uncharacterized protein GlcG (DUF336 family)